MQEGGGEIGRLMGVAGAAKYEAGAPIAKASGHRPLNPRFCCNATARQGKGQLGRTYKFLRL
jgi:hypothetical protein